MACHTTRLELQSMIYEVWPQFLVTTLLLRREEGFCKEHVSKHKRALKSGGKCEIFIPISYTYPAIPYFTFSFSFFLAVCVCEVQRNGQSNC